jgi:predicted HicB family RNase H-like nuclease
LPFTSLKDDKATPERVIPEAAPLRTSLAVSLSPRTIEVATKQAQTRGISLEAYLLLVLEQSLKVQ